MIDTLPSTQSKYPPLVQLVTGLVSASIMNGLSIFLLGALAWAMIFQKGSDFTNWHIAGVSAIHAAIVLTIAALVFRKSRATTPYYAWAWLISVVGEIALFLIGWVLFFIDGGVNTPI